MKNVPTNVSNLKNKVDKLDVDKLVPVPVDLSKLSDVVKMMLLKKMYMMLILITTGHDNDKYVTTQEFNKITRLVQANLASKNDIANFVKKTDFNDKLKNV